MFHNFCGNLKVFKMFVHFTIGGRMGNIDCMKGATVRNTRGECLCRPRGERRPYVDSKQQGNRHTQGS